MARNGMVEPERASADHPAAERFTHAIWARDLGMLARLATQAVTRETDGMWNPDFCNSDARPWAISVIADARAILDRIELRIMQHVAAPSPTPHTRPDDKSGEGGMMVPIESLPDVRRDDPSGPPPERRPIVGRMHSMELIWDELRLTVVCKRQEIDWTWGDIWNERPVILSDGTRKLRDERARNLSRRPAKAASMSAALLDDGGAQQSPLSLQPLPIRPKESPPPTRPEEPTMPIRSSPMTTRFRSAT